MAAFVLYTRFVTVLPRDLSLYAALGSLPASGAASRLRLRSPGGHLDITAVQRNWLSGLRLGMTYALGHAFTVGALGVVVLQMHWVCPRGWTTGRSGLIGLTLIVLGVGVVAGILRKDAHGHRHSRVESRLAIAINGILWTAWKVR